MMRSAKGSTARGIGWVGDTVCVVCIWGREGGGGARGNGIEMGWDGM